MAHVAAHGIGADLPPGWDARIYRRADPHAETYPVMHAATFPLPPDRGDFGSGAVEAMGDDDVLVVLVEFDRPSAGTELFRRNGLPRAVDPAWFSPLGLQRVLPGQSGAQHFFVHDGRPFCLYVVLGSHARRGVLVPKANELLARLHLDGERQP